jgi:hypothetical protein
VADVGDSHDHVYRFIRYERLFTQGQSSILEGRVRQAVAKREQRRYACAIVVFVTNIQAFPVEDSKVLAGPVMEGRRILDSSRECALEEAQLEYSAL